MLLKLHFLMCSIQITILPLVEAISSALGGEFKVYLSQLIPQILRIFHYDDSEKRTSTVCTLFWRLYI